MPKTSVRGYPYPDWLLEDVDEVQDHSWKNDTADKVLFRIADDAFVLWIESPCIEEREEDDEPRFRLLFFEDLAAGAGSAPSTDWSEAVIEQLDLGAGETIIETDNPWDVLNAVW